MRFSVPLLLTQSPVLALSLALALSLGVSPVVVRVVAQAQAAPPSGSDPAPSPRSPVEPEPIRFSVPGELAAVPPSPAATSVEPPSPAPEPTSAARSEAAEAASETQAEADAPATGLPDPASAEQTELRARIVAIERSGPLDDSVRRPLDFAKAALERSRASRVVGDGASETRTRQLSRAAVELAEARLRLLRERALFAAARGRRNVATAELGIAQHALERDRSRARELERASALP